jgi:putative PEP-CTERM system TPR-repeat lipoprotein
MRVSLLCVTAMLMVGSAIPSRAAELGNSEGTGLLATGRELVRNGDYRTALIQLKKAVRANPTNPDARFELGLLQFRSGDYVAAEKELIQARDNGFAIGKVSPLLANTYLAEGKFQQLLDNVKPCPTDLACKADVLALRARAWLSLRNLDNADAESLAALEVAPEGETSRTTRAIVLMVRNDHAAAERIIDTVLANNPRNSEALAVKGDLRRQAGDLAVAVSNYRSALEITPNDIRIRQSLAMALMASGHDDEARAEISQILKATPKAPMALYLKAVQLVRAQKTAEALDTVRPAEAVISQIPQGAFLLALIHARSNNLEEALSYASKFHAASPDSLAGAKLLANINLRLHAYPKVISILSPLRDRLGEDGEALELLGSAFLAEGRIKEANDLLTEAVRVQPNNASTRARLAVTQTRQSSTREDGIRELESLVLHDPKNQQVDLALVSAYIGGGDYDKAITAATTMARNQPEAPLPLTLRGAARLAKGEDQGARSDFLAALGKNPNFVPAAVYLTELDMQAGMFDQARRLLDDILKRNPTDLPALLARARVEGRANKFAAAVPFLEAAIRAHPGEVEPRVQLMRAQAALGDKDKLAASATDLARTQSTDPAAIDLAARTLFSVGKNEDGLNLYRKLQARFPFSPQLHERYGQALALMGRQEDARTAFNRAISTEPRYMPAWISGIALEQKMSGLDAAMAMAEKAKASNPDNPAALVLPGDLLLAAEKTGDAEAYYRKAFEQQPASLTALRLFHLMARKGHRTEADALLSGWVSGNPDDIDARITLAGYKSLQGDYRNAAAQYEAVSEKLPRNATILNNLAWIYGHLGDPRAVPVAKRAYSMSPDTPAFMDTYGCLLYRNGEQSRGRDLIRRAFDARPQDPQVAYHMAILLVDGNDPKGARNILKGVIESKAAFDGAEEARKLYSDLSGS